MKNKKRLETVYMRNIFCKKYADTNCEIRDW